MGFSKGQGTEMNEDEFHTRLQGLIQVVADLPVDQQKQLGSLLQQTQDQHQMEVDKITKSLTDLQICIKYLIFDLEATRRERDGFKEKLEK
jgi:hypothetical protein